MYTPIISSFVEINCSAKSKTVLLSRYAYINKFAGINILYIKVLHNDTYAKFRYILREINVLFKQGNYNSTVSETFRGVKLKV